VLVHLVEPTPADGSDPVRNYHAIRDELLRFDPTLAARPEVPVVSKYELPGADQVRQRLMEAIPAPVLGISAVTGTGLNHLISTLCRILDQQRAGDAAANGPARRDGPSP
jgi:GTP-binding protein